MSPLLQRQTNSAFGMFSAAAVGNFDSIATVTVGSGGSSTITFSSIPSSYTHLQIRGIVRSDRGSTEDTGRIRFNSDTGNNYNTHVLEAYTGPATAVSASAATSSSYSGYTTAGNNATSGIFAPIIIDILDYANTNKYKTIRILGGLELNTTANYNYADLLSGSWMSTSAITSIIFTPVIGTNWVQYSHFSLYGIKGAA